MLDHINQVIFTNTSNLIAILWFFGCFFGYFAYARKKSRNTPSLAYAMHQLRRQWIRETLRRENRIADTQTIGTLERSVSFFASSTLLILAGLMTLLGSTEKLAPLLSSISLAGELTPTQWQIKILLLLVIFIYAFFKFTWSLRQYGFMSVMVVGAPDRSQILSEHERNSHVDSISNMASKAANNFNSGMRTYYFSMSVLAWFISPWLFMAACGLIVVVLYRREFKSHTLKILMKDLANDQLAVDNTHKFD